ncbi:hypothetical protein Rsub_08795 [Raphidocelis subcapitata]|uniref:BPL/LPL catalytic domain-containing protein n=1 Tax=Raphidocelis subcapitata TaxID=307507 RepID=A0A2V0PEC8_9CHLO|nr:hypothetical protein Rsub_08795 [Raphidocelis subcapitata]|eukprot:GBF96250.1 hypothetical protein Rsub_08795 [Raphidocelis subcapitata]
MGGGVPVRVLRLAHVPILEQLRLEEALLRATSLNWLVVNDGTPGPTVVMGISGKVHEMLDGPLVLERGVPVLRRFSGGGTVVVDGGTVVSTLIMQSQHLPGVDCFPAPIMRWTERLYAPLFSPYGEFRLREHDYVMGHQKFGGNAQAITSRRWLHHTSLLWDFEPSNMALLTNPAKQPEYRQRRAHGDFLVRLRDVMPSREGLLAGIEDAAAAQGLDLVHSCWEEAAEAMAGSYLRQNRVVDVAAALQQHQEQQQQQQQQQQQAPLAAAAGAKTEPG